MPKLVSESSDTLLTALTIGLATIVLFHAVRLYKQLPSKYPHASDSMAGPKPEAEEQAISASYFAKSEEQKLQEEVDAQIWREMDEEIQRDLEQNLRRAQQDKII